MLALNSLVPSTFKAVCKKNIIDEAVNTKLPALKLRSKADEACIAAFKTMPCYNCASPLLILQPKSDRSSTERTSGFIFRSNNAIIVGIVKTRLAFLEELSFIKIALE